MSNLPNPKSRREDFEEHLAIAVKDMEIDVDSEYLSVARKAAVMAEEFAKHLVGPGVRDFCVDYLDCGTLVVEWCFGKGKRVVLCFDDSDEIHVVHLRDDDLASHFGLPTKEFAAQVEELIDEFEAAKD